MIKRRHTAIFAAVISATVLTAPSQANEVALKCKVDKGTNVSYLISTNPPSVEGADNGEGYEVVLFSPSKIIFRNISAIKFADVIMKTEWVYTINRSTLGYTVAHNVQTNSQSFRESFPSGTSSGKCSITPKKRMIF